MGLVPQAHHDSALDTQGQKRGLEALQKADPPAGYANWEWAALYFYVGGEVWKWQKTPPETKTVPSMEGPGRGGGSPPHDNADNEAHCRQPADTQYVTAPYIRQQEADGEPSRMTPSMEGPGRGGGSPPHDSEAKACCWKPIDTPYITATYLEWWDSNVGAWVTIRNDVGHCYKEMAGRTEMCHIRFSCQEHEVVPTLLER